MNLLLWLRWLFADLTTFNHCKLRKMPLPCWKTSDSNAYSNSSRHKLQCYTIDFTWSIFYRVQSKNKNCSGKMKNCVLQISITICNNAVFVVFQCIEIFSFWVALSMSALLYMWCDLAYRQYDINGTDVQRYWIKEL